MSKGKKNKTYKYLPKEYQSKYEQLRDKHVEEKTEENIDSIKNEAAQFNSMISLHSLIINS